MKLFNLPTTMIFGAPRSGTSWLGQIFNSHPDVKFCFQPLFSYEFKDYLTLQSNREDVDEFFRKIMITENDFILQKKQKGNSVHPVFEKNKPLTRLVAKHVRYHHLMEHLLEVHNDIKIIGIVRHPCGVINSWLKTPREFNPDWSISEWRHGDLKNQGRPEEYYGFEKWKEVAKLFLSLKDKYPNKFMLIQYEDLVKDKFFICNKVFKFCDLSPHDQTIDFLNKTNSIEINDPDTVYRYNSVATRWKNELNKGIIEEIHNDLLDTELEEFLYEEAR